MTPASPSPSLESIDMSASPTHLYPSSTPQLRHRHVTSSHQNNGKQRAAEEDDDNNKKAFRRRVAKNLDLFPKVERDYIVRTERGGVATLVGYGLIALLVLAETITWRNQNRQTVEHVVVDTSLGKRMRVNMNITFPSLHCDDLHVDVMDVAGDSQIDVDNNMVKRRLHLDGSAVRAEEIKVEANKAAEEHAKRLEILTKGVGDDYCGPCYGAHESEDQCCNTCDDVKEAYKKKKWGATEVVKVAEQCVREGVASSEPKKMSKGEGCNLSGSMDVNRVAGNFHIAMGEGVERDGRHIHQFLPEDAPNFNASHIVHELTFGPSLESIKKKGKGIGQMAAMNGVSKIVTEKDGTTGLFQYFIKVVPTTYRGNELVGTLLGENAEKRDKVGPLFTMEKASTNADDDDLELVIHTNRFFFTERFRPLMTEWDDEKKNPGHVDTSIGHGSATKKGAEGAHHKVQNSVLPGVFFVYEIYPFAVDVRGVAVPLTHLLIRIMATVGGVFTIVGWADAMLYSREKAVKRAGRLR